MSQGLWSTLQNMFKCSVSYLDLLRSVKLLCSAFVDRGTEDCNPKFQLEMEHGERLGSVIGVRHFCIRIHISLQIFELPEM